MDERSSQHEIRAEYRERVAFLESALRQIIKASGALIEDRPEGPHVSWRGGIANSTASSIEDFADYLLESESVPVTSEEFRAHPVAVSNSASWPSGRK